jgi:hypothetical protein
LICRNVAAGFLLQIASTHRQLNGAESIGGTVKVEQVGFHRWRVHGSGPKTLRDQQCAIDGEKREQGDDNRQYFLWGETDNASSSGNHNEFPQWHMMMIL